MPKVSGVLLCMCVAFQTAFGASTGVVISQIYTAGGNGGATYKNDFIELHNRGATPVSLSGWTVQYALSNDWHVTFLGGTLQPGQYYLVQEGQGGTNGLDLPPANATSSVNMNTTVGKVALVSNGIDLVGNCPVGAPIVDFVGYGVLVTCSEGSEAPAPGAGTALFRAASGCTDTDNNSADFSLGAPNPRNTFAAFAVCPNSTPVFISAQRASGAFTASFTADAAKSNQVQFTFDLVSWSNLAAGVSNAGSFFTFTDTNVASRRFYRVVSQ